MTTAIDSPSDSARRLDWVVPYLSALEECPLCAGKSWELRYELGPLRVHACRNCSLLFLNPCLKPEQQKMIFSSTEMLTKVSAFFADYYDDSTWATPKTTAIHRQVVREITKLNGRPGSILDIGCGKGAFLREAKSAGWAACGFEPNFEDAQILRQTHGIEIYQTDFWEAPAGAKRFDFVSMWDLIEHVPNPREWVRRCCEYLQPEGYLVFATPNHSSFLDFTADLAFRVSGGKWRYAAEKLYTVDHTLYLTETTLVKLFNLENFEVVKTIKVNTDLSRYSMGAGFRFAAETMLAFGTLLNAQNRMIMIAKRKKV